MNLYTKSVSSELYTLLCGIMQDKGFETFILGGGTSLSLRFGHRSSIDLDFFSVPKFDSSRFLDLLLEKYENIDIVNRTPGSICAVINDYKIDFLHHPYPLISEPPGKENIRFLSLPDIAAMKVNAVTNRGSKKDFFDLYLLQKIGISISKSLENFSMKYNGNKLLALRSLLWFEDADAEPDPILLNDWTWESVKKEIAELVDNIIN